MTKRLVWALLLIPPMFIKMITVRVVRAVRAFNEAVTADHVRIEHVRQAAQRADWDA